MSELFQIEESLSPRLRWMREHQITVTDRGAHIEPGDQCMETGLPLDRFLAHSPEFPIPMGGDTELEAIEWMAAALNIPLWNE